LGFLIRLMQSVYIRANALNPNNLEDSLGTMDKRSLTERDICTKFILPAVKRAGWDEMLQIREEVYFTKGRIIVRGKLVTRGKAKKADFVLYYKPNIPIALIDHEEKIRQVHPAYNYLAAGLGSLRLDACELDHLGPLLALFGDHLAEVGG
jgi:hypothetical protein